MAVNEGDVLIIPDTIEEEMKEIMVMPEFVNYEKRNIIRLKEEFQQDNDSDLLENINVNPLADFIAS